MELTYFLEIRQWKMDTYISYEIHNPTEVAEFSTAHGISDETAFASWVPYTLRKRNKTISTVNSRVKRTTNKYGVAVTWSAEEAYVLDNKNGNNLCRYALDK